LADDDEAGWDANPAFFPAQKSLFVVAVEGLDGCLQSGRQFQGVVFFAMRATFFGHVFADVFPEVSEHRHFIAWDVFSDWNAGQFHDSAFDGVHERKVAHGPMKQGALGVPRASQEERSGRQVHHA